MDPTARHGRRRRRQALAVAGSVGVHVALFLLAFSRASGGLVSAGDAGGGAVTPLFAVSLAPSPLHADASSRNGGLGPPVAKLAVSDVAIPIPVADRPTDLARLADRLRRDEATPATPDRRLSPSRPAAQPPGPAEGAGRVADRPGSVSGSALSTGTLWGQVEPCWRTLGLTLKAPVVVEVVVNTRGRLAGPPRVLRAPADILDEARLRSEAAAIGAIGDCLGRTPVSLGGGAYRLTFPAA